MAMRNMTLENIVKACNGTYHGDPNLLEKEVEGITLDSRQIEKDWLFVATKGERVDGHSFIPQVREKGACCVLCEKIPEGDGAYILVKDSFKALKDMAKFYRNSLDIKVVGITGSVGKTSTKEMIAGVLSEKYEVLKTAGNFNNEVGLPLTIFRIRDHHEIAVLEMGISDFGEMERLADIANPDIAVITNIGTCHLENLKDRKGVYKAKSKVFDYLKENGVAVMNADDDILCEVEQVNGKTPYFFKKVECADYMPEEHMQASHLVYADCIVSGGLAGSKCRIHFSKEGNHTHVMQSFEAQINVPGEHQVSNAACATMVGLLLNLEADEIKAGIAKVVPINGRTNIIQGKNYTIVDDCYNANPMSMKASAELLATANTRKVAVLGDMFELGKDSDALHYQTGAHVAKQEIDVICAIGENAKHLYQGALDQNNSKIQILCFEDKKTFLEKTGEILKKGDTILLKASHGMGFAELVDTLKEA